MYAWLVRCKAACQVRPRPFLSSALESNHSAEWSGLGKWIACLLHDFLHQGGQADDEIVRGRGWLSLELSRVRWHSHSMKVHHQKRTRPKYSGRCHPRKNSKFVLQPPPRSRAAATALSDRRRARLRYGLHRNPRTAWHAGACRLRNRCDKISNRPRRTQMDLGAHMPSCANRAPWPRTTAARMAECVPGCER